MKTLFLMVLTVLALLLVGCGAPSDVPSAQVADDPAPTPEEVEADPVEEETEEATEEAETEAETNEEAEEETSETEEELVEAEEETETGNKVPVDKDSSKFEFEGFAPGKSHAGTFTEMEVFLVVEDGNVVGMEGVINADSVESDSKGLDNHLKNEDFFDVEKFPTIQFSSMTIEDSTMTGLLTFHGVEKQVSFPVEVSDSSLTADFLLDTTPFEMKYIGVDKDVRISFDMKI